MTTLFLMRHGRSTANSAGVLAGRADGVALDETGRQQAVDAQERLRNVPLVKVFASPLLRTQQTAELAVADRGLSVETDERIVECDYGEWTGRALTELMTEPLWPIIQTHPSSVKFSSGETLAGMSARSVAFVRDRDREIAEQFGPHAAWLAVSHGDTIRAIVADALGLHLDHYQRLVVNPASITVIHYTPQNCSVLALNSVSGDAAAYLPHADLAANVGGGTGTSQAASPSTDA